VRIESKKLFGANHFVQPLAPSLVGEPAFTGPSAFCRNGAVALTAPGNVCNRDLLQAGIERPAQSCRNDSDCRPVSTLRGYWDTRWAEPSKTIQPQASPRILVSTGVAIDECRCNRSLPSQWSYHQQDDLGAASFRRFFRQAYRIAKKQNLPPCLVSWNECCFRHDGRCSGLLEFSLLAGDPSLRNSSTLG